MTMLIQRLKDHIAMMAPHQKDREGGRLLIEAAKELEDMYETGQKAIETYFQDGDDRTVAARMCGLLSHLPPETLDKVKQDKKTRRQKLKENQAKL